MNQLDRLMKKQKITAQKLSMLTGIPKQTIDAYRQNRRSLSLANALRICTVFHISPYDLLDEEDWLMPENKREDFSAET